MKTIIASIAIGAIFSAGIAYAAVNYVTTSVPLTNAVPGQTIYSFKDPNNPVECYVIQVSDSISCVKL